MNEVGDIRELERRLEELERLAASMDEAGLSELPGLLERTVELLKELNSAVDDRLSSAERAVTELDELLDGVDLESFDEELKEQE
ncbi:hypothetical protein E0L93_12080 [Rubrobacter taiwanensis]|uniref:Uncharacterized protein n=1 Tax=Rubrobacter taiwanensis TaxID=185139 RepID=A0A4R1BF11_9ACTN|nr:hypothetical protein [Rubrobacter taiwanensis]TCJ15731.1 hypothetical protein E0L93_12080 [Rubrobacter taiwanensis]